MTSTGENPAWGTRRNRKRAVLAVAPLVSIALFDLGLILLWGIDPLWGFAILPPILFISAIGWLYFGAAERDGEVREDEEVEDDGEERMDGMDGMGGMDGMDEKER